MAFESKAKNLVPSDTSRRSDIFVRDRVARTTERLSLGGVDQQAKGRTLNAALATDGRFVAFESFARNLVSGDTNGSSDVFVRERPPPVLGRSVSTVPVTDGVLVSLPGSGAAAADTVPGIKGRRVRPAEGGTRAAGRHARRHAEGEHQADERGKQRGCDPVGLVLGRRVPGAPVAHGLGEGADHAAAEGSQLRVVPQRRERRGGLAAGARGRARSSRKKTIRKLSGNAKGKFRTKGKHSSATVRGTKWTVTDRCDGTLTKVKRGKVTVRDFRRRRNVVVKAGKSYLARAR